MANRRPKGASEEIGKRLRAIRRDRGATLAEVSAVTGVSISALSKIENALISPSYDILKRIADGLELPIEEMVSAGRKGTVSGRKALTRIGEGARFRSEQYEYRAHADEISRKGMVPLEMVIRARSIEEFDHWSQHSGEEFVYVLAGSIEVHTEHYEPFRLRSGESAYFDSGMRHLYLSLETEDARVLSISHDPVSAEKRSVTRFMYPTTRRTEVIG